MLQGADTGLVTETESPAPPDLVVDSDVALIEVVAAVLAVAVLVLGWRLMGERRRS